MGENDELEYPSETSEFDNFQAKSDSEDEDSSTDSLAADEVFALNDESDSSDGGADEEEELLENFKKFNKFKYVKDNDDQESLGDEEEVEEGGWGNKRSNYYHDSASDYDSENERAEEEEASKIQQENLKAVNERDFLVDDFESLLKKDSLPTSYAEVHEEESIMLMEAEKIDANIDNLSAKQQMRLLKSSMPEVLHLTNQYDKVLEFLDSLATESSYSDASVSDLESTSPKPKLSLLYKNAETVARLYLAHIAFYFALVLDPVQEGVEPATAIMLQKTHPVLERIEVLEALFEKCLASVLDAMDEEENSSISSEGLEEDETVSGIEEDVAFDSDQDAEFIVSKSKSNKEIESNDIETLIPLEEYIPVKAKKSKKSTTAKSIDQFGESQNISRDDLQEKIRNKKSLQFHVSQVDQVLANNNMVKLSMLGDTDLPYKSKTKPSATKKDDSAAFEGSTDVDGEDSAILPPKSDELEGDGEEEQTIQDIYGEISDHSSTEQEEGEENASGDDESENEYYNMIKTNKMLKKQEREELFQQIHEPMGQVGAEDELDLPMDSKRKATYRILKNRGLTPYRKKENKNPRVKKRIKYDKALKKLSSVRRVAVDKVKVSTSKYGGEATGIKSNLSRSTKF